MNFAALPTVNVCPATPGLYFARMSCTGSGPLADGCGTDLSAPSPRCGTYNSPSGTFASHVELGGRMIAFM